MMKANDSMLEKLKKNQQFWLIGLIVVCMVIILAGGIRYVETLRANLTNQSIQNVMMVTRQQQQAFDNFVANDRERIHSISDYFSNSAGHSPEEVQQMLMLFNEVDAIYSVVCIDEGWMCSNSSAKTVRQLDQDSLDTYREFSGSGVRDAFLGIVSGVPRFGYYEAFTFTDGHKGLMQKSYDRSKVSETFSLSFYNDQGLAYVVNERGDILLRSVGMMGDHLYDNIFDVLTGSHGLQKDIDSFVDALRSQRSGSLMFSGDMGEFVYTYVPLESVEGWYLVSVVPEGAITSEADQILLNSQTALILLVIILTVCGIVILLAWRTHKEIKNKEQAIEYQTQLFDIFSTYLAQNTDDVYLMIDVADGHVEYISPNAERVLGITPENLLDGLEIFEITYPTGEKMDFESLRKLEPGTGTDTVNTEWTNPRTGEAKWFQQNVYCTQVQGNNKLVVYVSDRTKERKSQKSLAEALQMAQAANDAKSAFLSNVSHDIRTPMNAIIGFLALMRDEADNPNTVIEYTQRIDAASQHLLGLINDVLDMNKIESGSATLNISELNLAEVIEEINTIIRPQAKAKEQTFEIFVSHLNYEHLMGDKLRVNQILINLLSNAVKYTPIGGTIHMRVEELSQVVTDYSRIRFTVSDTGLGMSKEYLEVIFDPFTREETEVTHQIQGTGLGMAITKSLVDLMGGTITVDSELDKGSTFVVELELHVQELEDDPKFWTDNKITRMIVTDDDEDVCHNIVKTMEKTGVVTDYATSGEAAIAKMRQARDEGRPYDLILLDWQMPNLNGLETARLIRQDYSDEIPILLLTAYDWGEIEQEAKEIGIGHFMPKPFFVSTFKEAIRRLLGNMKEAKEQKDTVVQGKRILVVDDIEVNRIILVKILSTLGASCDTAGDGQEAVDIFEQSKPGDYDLILMDVQMPVMDGYTATRTIRSGSHPMAKDIPIIAMTANAFVDDVRDAIESGMDAHIAKPVQLDKLKSTIQQVLDNRAAAKK